MFELAYDCGNTVLSDSSIRGEQESRQDYTLSSKLLRSIPWYHQTQEEVDNLLDLPNNWNSYGAPKISIFRAAMGLSFICSISNPNTPKPAVVPTSKGGIQFEWHTQGIDLEIEFISITSAYVYFYDHTNPANEWEGVVSYDFRKLNTYMAKLSM